MKRLNLVVVGTGMYVCGSRTDGYGTIMPALFEWSKIDPIENIYIAGASAKGVSAARSKISELGRKMGVNAAIRYFPEGKTSDKKAYLKAFNAIPKPACAIVAVPDSLHREVAGAAIEHGLPVLVVKPLAPTMKEVRELIGLQDRNEVYAAVEFHKRLDHANMKLRDVIREGIIGDPLYFLAEFSQRKSIPSSQFEKWVNDTSIFQYLGIHYVDVIYFATGAAPLRAMATGQKGWLKSKGIDAYDAIEAVIEWKLPSGRKFSSHILTNWVDPESTSAMSDQKIKVIGTRGRFESDQKRRGITMVTDDRGMEEPNPYFCAAYGEEGEIGYKGYGIDSIHQFLGDVVRLGKRSVSISELEKTRPTFRASVVPTAVLEAVHKSLRKNGEWIDVDTGS